MVGGRKLPFSMKERQEMVNYIIEHQAYSTLKNDGIWQEMETQMTDRPWKSLRDQFKKEILPKIGSSVYGLTDHQVMQFKETYQFKNPFKRWKFGQKDTESFNDVESTSSSDPKGIIVEHTGPVLKSLDSQDTLSADEN